MVNSTPTRPADVDAIVEHCVGFVAHMLGRSAHDIDPNARFSRIGLDSANSVQLLVSLEEFVDMDLDPDLIVDYPTIRSLAAHVVGIVRPSQGADP